MNLEHLKKYFNENIKNVFTLDKNRIFSLIQLLQYGFLAFFLTVWLSKIINSVLIGNKTYEERVEELQNRNLTSVMLLLGVELIFFCFIYYYFEKILKLVPPIPIFFDKNFIPHKQMGIVIEVIFLYLFIEFSPSIQLKIERIQEIISPN